MLELSERRPPTIFNSLLLFCVYFVLLYMGNIEFKIDSKNDTRLQTPLHVLQHGVISHQTNADDYCLFYERGIICQNRIFLLPTTIIRYD
jgi:hypothetical protein